MPIKSLKGDTAAPVEPALDANGAPAPAAPSVIQPQGQSNLIDDLLGLDLGTPMPGHSQQMHQSSNAPPMGAVDLLSGGLDSLLDIGGGGGMSPAPQMNSNPMGGGMMDIFGAGPPQPPAPQQAGLSALGNLGIFGAPAEQTGVKTNKAMWCNPQTCMGLELIGEIVRRGNTVTMEMDITNKVCR